MVYTLQECYAKALEAGFSDPSVPCGIFNGESTLDPNVPCTCSDFAHEHDPSGWIHGFENCIAAKLTPACGLGQWQTTTAPALYDGSAPGCLGDLLCELKAMFSITNGGQCYQPWAGNAAVPAGLTNCTVSPLTNFSGSGSGPAVGNTSTLANIGGNCQTAECKACTAYDPRTYADCATCLTQGCGSPTGGNPLSIPGQLGSLIGDILNPKTWLNAGLVIAGFVTVMIGINALLSGKVAAGVKDSARAAVLA